MSQSFKFRYQQEIKENNIGESKPETSNDFGGDVLYPSGGGVRNLCFVLLDGRRLFLNYAYLVSGEYNPSESVIMLTFTTHAVLLKGLRLESLYEQLATQLNKTIVCVDERYNHVQGEETPVINNILVTNN